MDAKDGTFLVTLADDATAELVDVDDGQAIPLASNPGLDSGDVVVGTVAPDPPLGVSWSLVGVEDRHRVAVLAVDEPPGERARALARSLEVGELTRAPLANGEVHAFCVPRGETASAVEDIVTDEATRRWAARIGARRAEVRGAAGVVAVRYLSPEDLSTDQRPANPSGPVESSQRFSHTDG